MTTQYQSLMDECRHRGSFFVRHLANEHNNVPSVSHSFRELMQVAAGAKTMGPALPCSLYSAGRRGRQEYDTRLRPA
jgi:hypothetical protein